MRIKLEIPVAAFLSTVVVSLGMVALAISSLQHTKIGQGNHYLIKMSVLSASFYSFTLLVVGLLCYRLLKRR